MMPPAQIEAEGKAVPSFDLAGYRETWRLQQTRDLFEPLGIRGRVEPERLPSLQDAERLRFLMADDAATAARDQLRRYLVHKFGPSDRKLWQAFRTMVDAQERATLHSDQVRYLQAAELAYLRPLA